jgi:hypothetical protein
MSNTKRKTIKAGDSKDAKTAALPLSDFYWGLTPAAVDDLVKTQRAEPELLEAPKTESGEYDSKLLLRAVLVALDMSDVESVLQSEVKNWKSETGEDLFTTPSTAPGDKVQNYYQHVRDGGSKFVRDIFEYVWFGSICGEVRDPVVGWESTTGQLLQKERKRIVDKYSRASTYLHRIRVALWLDCKATDKNPAKYWQRNLRIMWDVIQRGRDPKQAFDVGTDDDEEEEEEERPRSTKKQKN